MISAVAGIGGGVLMVPFLYLVYAPTGASVSAQTLVAHATSLGVAFVAASVGTWRYAAARAILWLPALVYSLPGIASAFLTARILTRAGGAHWVRAAFGLFLLASAWDLARRARSPQQPDPDPPQAPHSWAWLGGIGLLGGAMSALLGIGGGLIAVPALLYVGRLPVRAVAPTALAGVCLTTLSGGLAYLTAAAAPPLSPWMAGFVDLRMALALAAGAVVTVPLGVRVNRRSSSVTLYHLFALTFAILAGAILWSWVRR